MANDSVSFCHYPQGTQPGELISLELLKDAIFWAMKENLNIQFLFPSYAVSDEYKAVIDTIDHASIVPSDCKDDALVNEADIVVFDSWDSLPTFSFKANVSYVVRCTKDEFFEKAQSLEAILPKLDRLVVVITDIETFTDNDFEKYSQTLESLIPFVKNEYAKNHFLHFNLLTDRILLDKMNNCNAGDESITLAPDGKFYICPAFYLDGSKPVGNLEAGLDIKNPQLYRLDHAPICRICDAYQCRRCVWLNHKTTLEVNTPSHEQCVVAHIERNASKKLLSALNEIGKYISEKEIKDIDYLDPFDIINQ